MKQIDSKIFSLLLIGAWTSPVLAAPQLHYSDLASVPVGGYVSLYGRGFGGAQGTIDVGVPVPPANILSWTDRKIQFRFPSGSTGMVLVVDGAGNPSSPIPLSAHVGRLFFIDRATGNDAWDGMAETHQGGTVGPWFSAQNIDNIVAPGDIFYVRNGVYPEIMDATRDAHVKLSPGTEDCTAAQPCGIVGYPGHRPMIGDGLHGTGFRVGAAHWTISTMQFDVNSNCFFHGGGGNIGHRVIDLECSEVNSNYGTIGLKGCTDCKILGNHVWQSGKAGNKLAHLIYYGGYGFGDNVEIAWNTLHDERGGRCIQIFGHTASDLLTGLSIHDNTAWNCPFDGILLGGADGATNDCWIKSADVYNNVVFNSGVNGIRINNCGLGESTHPPARVLNNTLYGSDRNLHLEKSVEIEVRNNILSTPGPDGQVLIDPAAGLLTMDHNFYQGGTVPAEDTAPITGNPLFIDPANPVLASRNYGLQAGSPAIGAGVQIANPPPWLVDAGLLTPDVGAVDFSTSGGPPIPGTPTNPRIVQ